jgi:2,5-diamino-6-(ribosylamino)-4(3H)-pyrimidinone 5'-phosphate reductase
MKDVNSPYIILSAAMSIDGKIASRTGDADLSDEMDWKMVHKLRTQVDAIMVGKGTILKDNPKLHIKYYSHKGYHRIVIDSKLTIPLTSNVIKFLPDLYPTIICTTDRAPIQKVREYEKNNVKVIKAGNQERVDLKILMPILLRMGLKKILLEGGGSLNWSFFEADLIDEIRLSIAPRIVGGKNAVSLVDGLGYSIVKNSFEFKLVKVKRRENYVNLLYKRMNS